jgi:hypothetical protein
VSSKAKRTGVVPAPSAAVHAPPPANFAGHYALSRCSLLQKKKGVWHKVVKKLKPVRAAAPLAA